MEQFTQSKDAKDGRKRKQHAVKCIYFPDVSRIERLEAALSKFPRASLSSIIAQTVEPLTLAITQLPEGQRQVKFEVSLWI